MGGKFWPRVMTGFLLIAGIGGCDRTTPQEHVERAQGYVASGDPRSARCGMPIFQSRSMRRRSGSACDESRNYKEAKLHCIS